MRVLVVVPCVVLGVLGTPEGWQLTAALAGTLAVAWCGLSLHWLRADTPPVPVVAGVALSGVLVVELTQFWTAPGFFNGWAFAIASITVISMQFELATRPWVAALVSVTTALAYVAGSAFLRPLPDVTLLGVRLLVETGLSRAAYLVIRSRARVADRGNARAADRRRAAEVSAARRAAEREYLATLHDTASATLLMVSLGAANQQWLPGRAKQDLDALTTLPRERTGELDLAALLTQATDYPGMRVEREAPAALPLPTAPALAIAHGVREAVRNVAHHAGVPEATLRAARYDDGTLVVELSDHGAGFDPGQVGPHHRGLSGSIAGRMAEVGGLAEIRSAPGEGTTVRWTWHG
ncbi:sensor histidine kinase [Prauserella cavernicola]|uniref:ATP-binding protein n=1 Tax=Prauserella cavernicola TaxID=2800127 RepID=A0A934QNT8_9PSEU|nr:ATP-binding protein [Prauserella cavernicola]MBK1783273.1 ATP-binding protein [Prauserella cavernicola]